MELDNATAVVTGGGSGLGEAAVESLVRGGANAVIADFNQEKGAALAVRLREKAVFARADVRVTAQLRAAMSLAVERFGRLDVLVNCAGIGSAMRTLSRQGPHDLDLFRMVIDINLVGTFDAMRLAAEKMALNEPGEDGERGVIINTASLAAFEGQVGQAAYAASKAGVVGLTLPAARDLASLGIRVCTIAPGVFDTALMALTSDEVRSSLAEQTPFPRRMGRPAEFAMLVRQIIENRMLNGETIRLDGALRMGRK